MRGLLMLIIVIIKIIDNGNEALKVRKEFREKRNIKY